MKSKNLMAWMVEFDNGAWQLVDTCREGREIKAHQAKLGRHALVYRVAIKKLRRD